MSLTLQALASYLGGTASALLSTPPFEDWTYQRSYEHDSEEEPRIDYVFAQDGVDLVCDGEDKLTTIFLYCDGFRRFQEGLEDLPFTSTRREVVDYLGVPAKSGGPLSDPILGEYGAWDRFARPGYAVRVEYRVAADLIRRVTLMRADVVP